MVRNIATPRKMPDSTQQPHRGSLKCYLLKHWLSKQISSKVIYANVPGLNRQNTNLTVEKNINRFIILIISVLENNINSPYQLYHNLKIFQYEYIKKKYWNIFLFWNHNYIGGCSIGPPLALRLRAERSNTPDCSLLSTPWAESWWMSDCQSLLWSSGLRMG